MVCSWAGAATPINGYNTHTRLLDSTMPDVALKICPSCKESFSGKRIDAIYCSKDCKQFAYYSRKGIEGRKERNIHICERIGCDKPVSLSTRSDTKYCSNACRQKVWHSIPENKLKAKKKHAKKALVKKERIKKIEAKKAVDDYIKELMGE